MMTEKEANGYLKIRDELLKQVDELDILLKMWDDNRKKFNVETNNFLKTVSSCEVTLAQKYQGKTGDLLKSALLASEEFKSVLKKIKNKMETYRKRLNSFEVIDEGNGKFSTSAVAGGNKMVYDKFGKYKVKLSNMNDAVKSSADKLGQAAKKLESFSNFAKTGKEPPADNDLPQLLNGAVQFVKNYKNKLDKDVSEVTGG